MKLLWDSPWYVTALCVLAGAAFAALLYYKTRGSALSPAPRWALATLRFFTVSACCLLLASILLRSVHNESQEPIIVIAVDNSSSMVSGSDSSYVRDGLEGEIRKLEQQAGDRYEFATLYFASEANERRPEKKFAGKETDINELLHVVSNNYANQNVGALVLISDGIYNKGSSPVYAAGSLGFPVFALGVGDTAAQTDVAIKRVDHNQIAYLGNNFPVIVHLTAKKAAGRSVKVEILQGGSVKGAAEVRIAGPNYAAPLTFTLNASSAGALKYTARISGAGNEKNTRNNQQDFVVEVLDNKEKILLAASAPHPDVNAIREALLANTSYALTYAQLNGLPAQLRQYNLVIVHGYSPAAAHVIQQCRQERVPFWIVNPASAEELPGVRIVTGLNRYNEVEPFVDETFGYFGLSAELRSFLADVPAVSAFFGTYQLPQGSSPLLLQRLGSIETNQPLLYFNASDETRFAVFIGEGLWKWKLRDYALHGNTRLFAELVSKSVQYLAAREDKSFFRVAAPRIIADNDVLEFTAELYNKSYEPVNAPDVTITIMNERRQKYNYTFSKTGKAYRLTAGTFQAGEYTYRASVTFAGESFVKEGRIVIRETVAERVNTVADHNTLRQIASRSGGAFYTRGQLQELSDNLIKDGKLKTIVYSQTVTRPLIEEKLIFFVLLAFLAIEWFIRKRYLVI